MKVPLSRPQPDFNRLLQSLTRRGRPDRLAAMELFCDREIMCAVLGIPTDKFTGLDYVRFQQVMGYDYLNAQAYLKRGLFHSQTVDESNPESLVEKRNFMDEQSGPIQNWEDFEKFQFPTVDEYCFDSYQLYSDNLPKGMKIIAWLGGFFEHVSWSTGIQPFCYLLMDNRPLVKALFDKWAAHALTVSERSMDQPNVGAYWLSDDLGFNSGPFMSPADCREFVMPVYAELGRMCRARGIPFILHSCGKLDSIFPDLIACGVDCLHSVPPNLYDLAGVKRQWGKKLSFAGNIDLNILGLGTADETRQAVRLVKQAWAQTPTGGVILSSANTVANYCKVDNYLAMMDELFQD